MDENNKQPLLEKIGKTDDIKLPDLIAETYEMYTKETSDFLKKWQKGCIIKAITAYYAGLNSPIFFRLCRANLKLALELEDNISKDPKYLSLLNKYDDISEDILKETIQQLVMSGP